MVIFLFLRNVSATIIPSLALPFSIVGTFAVMYLLGYSLDNLSLMALTLSVGFVVDDAIVMLENIVRHMEMGEDADAGGARRLAGDRLHHRVDDDVAGGGVHPGAVHGRHRRPADARVRGHDRRRDPGLRLRLADADADAVQPLPEAAARDQARPALQRDRARSSTRCCAATRGRCGRRMRFTAGDDGGRRRCCWSARSTCSTIVPKGFIPSAGHRPAARRRSRRAQGIGFEAMVAQQQKAVDDRRRSDPERRQRSPPTSAAAVGGRCSTSS